MNLLKTFKEQFLSIFDKLGLMVIMFVGPIFLVLFMGGVYVNDYVKDISIAVLDEDNSSLSRMITDQFVTNERFDVKAYPVSRSELNDLIESGEAHMGLWFPQGFESGATTFEASQIMVILDGTNLVVSNNAYAQATTIVQTINGGVEMRLIQGKGLTPSMSERIAKVINIGERILFDSKLAYMNYLILCFMAVFLQQLYLSAIGNMLLSDKAVLAQGFVLPKMIGTSLACIVGFIPATSICFLIIKYLYKVPIRGSYGIVGLMAVIFLLGLTGPAMILASVMKERINYAQFSLMLSMPTFVTSGSVWPVEQMPKAMEIGVKMIWPLINFGKVSQEVLLKDQSLATVMPYVIQLSIYCVISMIVGTLIYKYTFKEDGGSEPINTIVVEEDEFVLKEVLV